MKGQSCSSRPSLERTTVGNRHTPPRGQELGECAWRVGRRRSARADLPHQACLPVTNPFVTTAVSRRIPLSRDTKLSPSATVPLPRAYSISAEGELFLARRHGRSQPHPAPRQKPELRNPIRSTLPLLRESGSGRDAAIAVDVARPYVGRGWASARRPALLGLVRSGSAELDRRRFCFRWLQSLAGCGRRLAPAGRKVCRLVERGGVSWLRIPRLICSSSLGSAARCAPDSCFRGFVCWAPASTPRLRLSLARKGSVPRLAGTILCCSSGAEFEC
jgi:hypothetical protein